MTDDDRMDALLRQMAAEDYHRPPDIVPREQMWDAVRQGLGAGQAGNGEQGTESGSQVSFVRRIPRWVYFAAAAVLLLAVGIQVGRTLGPRAGTTPDGRMAKGTDSLQAPQTAPQSATPQPDVDVAQNERSDDGTKPRPKPRPEPERALDPNAPNDAYAQAYTVAAAQHLTEVEAMLTAFKGDLNQGRMDAQIASWGKDLLSNTRLLLDSPAATDPVRRKLLQDLELVLVQIVQLSPGTSARDRDLIKGALTDDQVLTRLRTAIPGQKGT